MVRGLFANSIRDEDTTAGQRKRRLSRLTNPQRGLDPAMPDRDGKI
ncbi:MAG: hypothetical protein AAF317_04300 [Pseudomonadota bacterium]